MRDRLYSGIVSLFFIVVVSKFCSSLMLVSVDIFSLSRHGGMLGDGWSIYTAFVGLGIVLPPAFLIVWQSNISLEKRFYAGGKSFLLSFFFAIVLLFAFLYITKKNEGEGYFIFIPDILAFYAPLFFCMFLYISMRACLYVLPLPLRAKEDVFGNKIQPPKVYTRGISLGLVSLLVLSLNMFAGFLPVMSPSFAAMPGYVPYVFSQGLILYLLSTKAWKVLRIAYIGSCLSFFFVSGHEDIFWQLIIGLVILLQVLCVVHLYSKDSEKWLL